MDVSAGVALYLSERAGVLRPSTLAKHKMTLTAFEQRFTGREVGTITAAQIIEWRNSLATKSASRNKYLERVNAFYRHLKRHRYVAENPCDEIDPLDEGAPRRVRLDPQILPRMLEVARHPRDRAIVATAVELLLRGNELASLRVGDFKGRTLLVHVSKMKGELSEDEMAISDELAFVLREWMASYRRACGLVEADAYLFPRIRIARAGSESKYRLDPHAPLGHPEEAVKLALRAAGATVEDGTGVHAIRRSCARLLFDALCDVEHPDPLGHVSALMHHSSRRTTELYLGVTGDRVRRNKLVVNTGTTPLSIAMAGVDKVAARQTSGSGVYRNQLHSV